MSRQYERVNAHDEDDESPYDNPRSHQPVPSSPPPSFHSRSPSPVRRNGVDPTLADAFDDDDDDNSDDEGDVRQRLVRQNSTPSIAPAASATTSAQPSTTSQQPTTQQSPTTNNSRGRVVGGGVGSDGVFANLSARPERGQPEKEEMPPTYEQAAADAAPPYWETTILAPGMGGPDEVYIDGLPVGSIFSFVWNGMISILLVPLVGFLLTYLLHSTHAAKNGSLAGFGVTLIQYGFVMKGSADDLPPEMTGPDGYADPPNPNSHDFNSGDVTGEDGSGGGGITSTEWLAYLLMIVGWFVLIKSVADFLKARRHEMLVLQSPDRGLSVPVIADGEDPERVV